MAFFGSDGADNQVRQLKHQLGQKDAQIATYMQELQKKDDLLAEHKRAKEDAVYKAAMEADRALKASSALTAKTSELNNTLMRLSNLESMLETSTQKAKQDEKEIRKLQYELDSKSQSSGPISRVTDMHATLEAKIKSLEADLKRSESEKETILVEMSANTGFLPGFGASSGVNERTKILNLENQVEGLRKENIRLMEESRKALAPSRGSPSRSPFAPSPSPRLKRTTSVSGDLRVHRLEAELETLRSQLNSDYVPADFDAVKRNLDAARREVLKLTNEKMAVERSSQKELEEMRSKLEDLNEELEDLRGQQQSGSSVEDLVALKKEAAMDQSRLEDQIRALQAEVQRRSDEVQRLQANVDNLSERLQQKEDELERAVSEAQLKVMNPGGGDESVTIALRQESRQLQQHVADLTAQLERALAAQAEAKEPVPSSTSDEVFVAQRKIRQMERELAGLKRDKAALEDDLDKNDQILAAKDREIMQLRRNVPLPSSRPSTPEPAHGDDMADERIAMLVNDCDQLRELEKELRQRIAEQDGQIREAGENLAKSRAQIAKMAQELQAAQSRLEAVDAEKMEMEKALKAAQAELHLQQTEVAELQQDRDRLVSEQQEAAQVSSERVNTLEAEIAAIANQQEALQSASDEVRRLQAQVEDLQRILDSHCEEDTAKQALSEEKAELLVQVAALRTCAQEWELQEFGARQERDACREELAILHEQAEAHAGHVAELLSAQEEKTDEAAEQVRALESALTVAQEAQRTLTERVCDLENTLANQTTDSEVRQREESLFDLKEFLAQSQKEVEAAKLERDEAVRECEELRLGVARKTEAAIETAERLREAEVDLQASQAQVHLLIGEVDRFRAASDTADSDKDCTIQSLSAKLERTKEAHLAAQARSKSLEEKVAEQRRLLQFAELEHRFTLEASASHEASIKELTKAKEAAVCELKQTRQTMEEIKSLQTEVVAVKELLEQAQDRVSVLELSLDESEDARKQTNNAKDILQASLETKLEELARLQAERNDLQDRLECSGQPVNEVVATTQREKRELEARVNRRNKQLALEQDKIRKLEMNLALAAQSVRDLEETIKELQDELATERAATKAAKTSLSLLSGRTEGIEEALEAARGDLADATQEVDDLSVALISLVALQVEGIAAKRSLFGELQSTHRELTEKQKDVALFKSEQDKLSAEIASSHRDNNQLRSEKADLLAAGEEQAVRFSQEIEALQAELTASIDEIVVLKSDTERLQSKKQALQNSQLQVETELSSAVQRSADLNQQLETMRSAEAARSTQLESRLHLAEASKKELEEAIATARSRLEAREVEMAVLGKRLQEALSGLETSTAGAREIELKLTAAMNDLEDVRIEIEIVKRNSAESIAALEANHSSIAEEKQQLVQKASETEERVNLLENEIEALQVANKEILGSTERIRQLETEIEDLRASRDGALESAELAFARRLQSEQERLLHKVSEADGRIVQLEAQIKDLQRVQSEEMQSAKANFLQKLRESEEKVQELEAQRSQYLVTSEKLVSEGSELRSELALTTASIEQLKQCSADAEQRAGQAELRLVELQRQLQEAQAEADDLRTSASDYAAGLDQAKLQAQDALAKLEEAKREVEREYSHAERLRGQLTEFERQHAIAEDTVARLETERHEAEVQVQQLKVQLEKLVKEASSAPDMLEELAELKEAKERLVAQCEAYVKEQDVLDDQLKETNKVLSLERRKREKLERKMKQLQEGAVSKPPTLTAKATAESTDGDFKPRTTLATIASADTAAELHNQSASGTHRTPSGAHKRGRDGDDDPSTKKKSAEAIIAPAPYDERQVRAPGTPRLRTPAGGLRSFTPQRSANRPKRMEEDQNLPPMPGPFAMEMLGRTTGTKSPFAAATATPGGMGGKALASAGPLGLLKDRVASFTAGEAGRLGAAASSPFVSRNVTQ